MYKLFRIAMILIVIMLFFCLLRYSPVDSDDVNDLKSKQVVEYYFNAINKKQYDNISLVLSDEMRTRTFNYEDTKYIKLLSIEKVIESNLTDIVKDLYEVDIYRVEINVEQYSRTNKDQKVNALFYVGKETADSAWLIYDEYIWR